VNRVLVTGGTGFIGRHVLGPLVQRGFEVHAVGRRAGDAPDVRWHEADLLDGERRAALVTEVGASHLLHLAWHAEHGKFWTAPENVDWVGATSQLVREFAAGGGLRAVLAGSCAEYDWSAASPLSESASALRPATLYGVSKDATRRVVERLVDESAWGRIFFLYGPGEDERRLVSGVARRLVAGEPAAVSEGTQLRDFLHVSDVASAFVALLDSDVTGAVNIASGQGVAVRDVAATIARAAGREDLLNVGTLPMRPDDPRELVADVRRLESEVGWSPSLALDAGISETVAWWRRMSR